MVKITNGSKIFEVSRGAYDSVYKGLGFHVVGTEPAEDKPPKEKMQVSPGTEGDEEDGAPGENEDDGETEPGENEDDGETEPGEGLDLDALLEKPLSQWETDELKEFVRAKGIDIAGAKKVSRVRDIVKKYLDDQAKAEA